MSKKNWRIFVGEPGNEVHFLLKCSQSGTKARAAAGSVRSMECDSGGIHDSASSGRESVEVLARVSEDARFWNPRIG